MSLAYEYNDKFEKDKIKDIYTVVNEQTLYLFICKPRRPDENPLRHKSSKIRKQLKRETKKAAMERAERQKALLSFEAQYVVRLDRCQLHLKPDDLPIRRIWNKKYPMKLCVPQNAILKKKIDSTLEELTLNMSDILKGVYVLDSSTDHVDGDGVSAEAPSGSEDEEIFLFSNTGREKEDLFYRMQLCIRALKHQVTFDDLRKGTVSKLPRESYPHYMIDLITESERVMQRNIKGKKMEPHLAWLNIFIGRAFWDFWHESYWIDKLHQKIQTRLSKLNTPPFITHIKLKDLDCGHNVPIIHKGSVPTLDEYGVWTDLQITYKGYFTLTLETQLNVDYYVGLVSSIVKQKSTNPKYHSELSKLTKLSELNNSVDDDEEDGSSEHAQASFSSSEQQDSFLNDTLEDEAAMMRDELQEVYGMEEEDGLDHTDNAEGLNVFMADPRYCSYTYAGILPNLFL